MNEVNVDQRCGIRSFMPIDMTVPTAYQLILHPLFGPPLWPGRNIFIMKFL